MRWKPLGSTRKTYASVTAWEYPEMLAPGEPREHALIFTEREGLEHLRAELDASTRKFNLGIFGDPKTWRRLDKRTKEGRAALAAQKNCSEARHAASNCGSKLRAFPKDLQLKAERERLLAEFYKTEHAYVEVVKLLPTTPHPGPPR